MYLRTRLTKNALLLLACMGAAAASAQHAFAAGAGYQLVSKQLLAGPVRWDYLAVDSASHRVFVTRGDHVDVFDATTKTLAGTIADTQGVHGVAVASDINRGYTSNGATNSVTVFDLQTLAAVTTVKVGDKPDAIVYDPASKRVFVANGKDKTFSVIDSASNQVIRTIALAGTPETAVVNNKGLLFVAIEDKNAIAVVDTSTLTVLRQFDISAGCDEPAGLAIDAATDRLFAGCHNGKMAVVDGRSGKLLASPAIGKGNDATGYDAQLQRAFASNGEGTLTIVDGAAPYKVLQTVPTMARGRTMALDTVSHQVFIVAAEVDAEAPVPAKGRAPLKAGSFTLLTLAPTPVK